jgi:RimJ/RimL family protein N-acetyltransferase
MLADNYAGLHLYEKCLFIVDGRLRNHMLKQGGWKDLMAMGICADDDTAKKMVDSLKC